jgi:hypothetical protein
MTRVSKKGAIRGLPLGLSGFLALGALVSLGTLAACNLSLGASRVGPSNTCDGPSDCGSGRCDPELGLCVRDATDAYSFTLTLALPASIDEGRPVLVTAVGPFTASSGDALVDVQLRSPVPVAGRVRAFDDGTPIEADIVFMPRVSVLGPALPTITVPAMGLASLSGEDPQTRENDYATQLVPGISYDVEIRPRGADIARFAPRRAVLELDIAQRFDIQLLPSGEHFILSGRVVDHLGVGQNGLEIRAIDAMGRVVSSVATTSAEGAESGHFELHVDPTIARWTLRISAPPTSRDQRAFPTITVDPAVLANEGTREAPRVRILVPSAGGDSSVCFVGIVETENELSTPVVGATVTLRSREISDEVTRLVGTYTIEVASVAGPPLAGPDMRPVGCSGEPLPPGGFEARIVPGTYDVEIRPIEPELGVYASGPTASVPIYDETYGHVFRIPLRPRLSGIVQESTGEPMIGARIRGVPLHLPAPLAHESDAWHLNRPGEAISDGDGAFRLPLDVGVYDLIAESPGGSGFPWVVRPGFAMAASEWTEIFDVRHPVALRGQARFEDGFPVAGAEIEAYAIIRWSAGERAVPVGRATTDAEGGFLLLLPPEL